MDAGLGARRRLRISLLMIPCLAIGGGALHAQNGQIAAPDRLADASHICRATMGLNPANAPYDVCIRSLIQNEPSGKADAPPIAQLTPVELSCAQFGVKPGTAEFGTCASNLGATMDEVNHPVPQ